MFIHNFFKNKNILVTGHTGFKGVWLTVWLLRMGANVNGYSFSANGENSLFDLCALKEKMVSNVGDIRDIDNLSKIIKKVKPEIIFHLAAQSLVRKSYIDPIETFSTNIMGTANLLEVSKATDSVRSIVIVTSDKCYKDKKWHWGYRENDELGGYDPYSSSKSCAEIVVSSYIDSFYKNSSSSQNRVALASVRSGNVMGGGDMAKDRLIPDLVRSFSSGQQAIIRNHLAVRPWQHVLDTLYGYLLVAKNPYEEDLNYANSWNFGPDQHDVKNVKWIADKSVELWGDGVSWTFDKNKNPHETSHLILDSSKANQLLGWKPRWKIDTALMYTIQWYKNLTNNNAFEMINENINEYGEI
jgi:CDP-glucose 4,6-dehydratase